jgi:hypothetical protein
MRVRESTERSQLQNSSTGGLTVDDYRDVDADVIIVKPNRIYSLEFGLFRTCTGCTLYKYKYK